LFLGKAGKRDYSAAGSVLAREATLTESLTFSVYSALIEATIFFETAQLFAP
jgi:hypothetical protein